MPATKEMPPAKAAKAYIDKNKKILKTAIQNDIYMHNNRKLSTLSKSSKGKSDSKHHGSSVSNPKEKGSRIYNNSSAVQNTYGVDATKFHKRSSSDSQKLYDLNKYANFHMPSTKVKCKTNENSSRLRK